MPIEAEDWKSILDSIAMAGRPLLKRIEDQEEELRQLRARVSMLERTTPDARRRVSP